MAVGEDARTGDQSEPRHYRCIRAGFGYYTFEVDSYTTFITDIAPKFVAPRRQTGPNATHEFQTFLWRGMQNPAWSLQASLSRQASRKVTFEATDLNKWQRMVSDMTTDHLLKFLGQLRGLGILTREHNALYELLTKHIGRRHLSFLAVLREMSPRQQNLTHDLVALGQHHGLLTPFLDWTLIPLIALYFAFEQPDERRDGIGSRVVFALNKTAVERICPPRKRYHINDIMILGSMAHENPRLVAQSGLFTFSPAHLPVDQWVVQRCKKASVHHPAPVLLRFLIRNQDRDNCLAELSALNINARTVFPDRFGASLHSNYLFDCPIF